MTNDQLLPDDYGAVLDALKTEVRRARFQAQRSVNTELIRLYWRIGRTLRDSANWGGKVVERLADDLRAEFPEMKGLSRSNLYYMRQFAQAWESEAEFVQQPVGQIPWGHITVLLAKLDRSDLRNWYAAAAVENGWSRNVLEHQIVTDAYARFGAAPSNFRASLPAGDSDLAQQLTRDPLVLDFLAVDGDTTERRLEDELVGQINRTLHELGPGFAFVGRQVHFDIGGDDFFIDLLFFHVEQLRYVVVELKTGPFKPEYTGQLGFYIEVVERRLRRPNHERTVGVLWCQDKNGEVVEYALASANQPIAVASYDLLPADAKAALPPEAALRRALKSRLA